MKKLMVITRNLKAGGAERVISQLVNNFCEEGIECIIVTIDDAHIFYTIDPRVKIYSVGKKSDKLYIDKFLKYKAVRKYAISEKPDVVLALPEEIGIFVIPALLGTGIPVVVSERNNPWVMPWKKETRLMRRLFYPFAAGFIFQTDQAASFFPKYIQKKGIVLPNPLDLVRIPEPWREKRRKEVVGAGRLEKQKNFKLLIQAFAQFYRNHPDYILTIYGEGSLRKELEELAASILPEGVYRFPGNVPNLLEQINGAAMFVLSSDYEGMPNVLIEAMAMGMPVISTDCPSGGPAYLINNRENGILIPVGDVDSLCKAMCKIAEDPEFSQCLGKNACLIKKKLDSAIISKKWREFLSSVAKQD